MTNDGKQDETIPEPSKIYKSFFAIKVNDLKFRAFALIHRYKEENHQYINKIQI